MKRLSNQEAADIADILVRNSQHLPAGPNWEVLQALAALARMQTELLIRLGGEGAGKTPEDWIK